MANDAFLMMGLNGAEAVTSASAEVFGPFRGILIVNDAVLDIYQPSPTDGRRVRNHTVLVGPTLPAGLWIGGAVESVQVNSGIVIAYDL